MRIFDIVPPSLVALTAQQSSVVPILGGVRFHPLPGRADQRARSLDMEGVRGSIPLPPTIDINILGLGPVIAPTFRP